MNYLKVHALGGSSTTVHVVTAFVSRVRFMPADQPVLTPPGQEDIELVQHIIRQRLRDKDGSFPTFVFFTVGSLLSWPEEMAGYAAGDHWLIVSNLNVDGSWDSRTPPRFADRYSLRNFMDLIKPETRQQRISRIKTFVDELLDSGFEGNLDIELIKRKTKYRRTTIREAFLTLQGSDHYDLYKTREGRIAVDSAPTKKGKSITLRGTIRSWPRVAAFGVAFVGILATRLFVMSGSVDPWTLAVMAGLGVVGELTNRWYKKTKRDRE